MALSAIAASLESTERPLPIRVSDLTVVRNDRFYRPELDLLRLFAFLSVFLHHGLPGFELGHHSGRLASLFRLEALVKESCGFGVCLFFLLSAYLITELLERERTRTGGVHVQSFYARRVLRIWPLYFFFLLAGVALGVVIPSYRVEPVFDGRYVLPLAPLLIAFAAPFLLPSSPVLGNRALRWVAGGLFALGAVLVTVYWGSPFRSLRRDYQTSTYSTAAALRQIPSCDRLVAIGEGPFPAHGVGWEAGIYASYFAQCHLVGFSDILPAQTIAVLKDVQSLHPDSILLFGKPLDPNYELLLKTIREQGLYPISKTLVDPDMGEIGQLLAKP